MCSTGSIKGSDDILQAADTDGKKPYRLALGNFSEPSIRPFASSIYFSL